MPLDPEEFSKRNNATQMKVKIVKTIKYSYLFLGDEKKEDCDRFLDLLIANIRKWAFTGNNPLQHLTRDENFINYFNGLLRNCIEDFLQNKVLLDAFLQESIRLLVIYAFELSHVEGVKNCLESYLTEAYADFYEKLNKILIKIELVFCMD